MEFLKQYKWYKELYSHWKVHCFQWVLKLFLKRMAFLLLLLLLQHKCGHWICVLEYVHNHHLLCFELAKKRREYLFL